MLVETNLSYLVAFSGGVDSHVLLHKMKHATNISELSAIHIDHNLHPDSKRWSEHCQKICAELAVPLTVVAVNIEVNKGDSLEEQARIARYKAILPYVNENTVLLSAQHADDQAETVLLQLCRGAGIAGLAAMPEQKPFGQGVLERPLLKDRKSVV